MKGGKNKMKTKIIKIEDVKVEDRFYPRDNWDYVTKARYFNALKSGAIFPNIEVAEKEGNYYLIDGQHRLLARKDLGETHLSCDVYEGLSDKEIYIRAVKSNIGHGRQFSTREVTKIAINLEEWDLSLEEISEIIRLPSDSIKPFIAKRIVSIYGQNSPEVLKHTVNNLAGMEFEETPNRDSFGGSSQERIFSSVIELLETPKLIDLNANNLRKLLKIKELINSLDFLQNQTPKQAEV